MAEKEEAAPAAGGSNKLIIIILIVLIVVVIGVGAALFLMLGSKDDAAGAVGADGEVVAEVVEAPKNPVYVPLHPAFLVNFQDQSSASHLQVDVQVMTYDEAVRDAVKTHMPQIRNDLLLLFGSQKYEELNTVKGKRELSKKSIEVVAKVLKEAGAPHTIEAFLFTSFVMQ